MKTNGGSMIENSNNKIEKKVEREKWKKAWDFLFASAGCSIGLGNVWRFPYLCFKYGGGSFLVPYLLSAIFLGIPLLLLEISFGQALRKGIPETWGSIPLCKGIAFANGIQLLYTNYSYPVVLAWALKYLTVSFWTKLPWFSCDNDWNTEACTSLWSNDNASETWNNSLLNVTTKVTEVNRSVSANEEYWNYGVLGITSGVDHIGTLRGDLVLCLAVIWILTYLATFQGIKWSAKIIYVTATLPALLIIVVLVRGVTLEGASQGIYYYLKPNITQLKNGEVWVTAASQVIYSYGICAGTMLTLGSFNRYHHNFFRDGILIAVTNGVTSIASGFAVFSTLGFMASYRNVTMQEVVESGPGLVFIAYPQALSLLPQPQLWNVLFFLTVLLLGFDTLFVNTEALLVFIMDLFPVIRTCHRYSRQILLALLIFTLFVTGLIFVSKGGVYVFEMCNVYGLAGWCLFFIAACEFTAVGWLHGADRHWKEINQMIGPCRTQSVITFIWKYLGPVLSVVVCIYYLASQSILTYGSYKYPAWAMVICHLISALSVMWIPSYVIYVVIKTRKPCWEFYKKTDEDEETQQEEQKIPLRDVSGNGTSTETA